MTFTSKARRLEHDLSLPLKGLTVLEFSQYLSGPSAGLRLSDLGARVIKIERPGSGDACRKLAISNLWVDDSSLLFHTINRNKESFAADLKHEEDLDRVRQLIARADVMTHNFRPGIMEKIGLGYEEVRSINPKLVYATVTGYGKEGPWKDKPGQDLLIQSLSGLLFTSGNRSADPTPFGLAIADIMGGSQLVQGILAALIRRNRTGRGALVEVSLMESILDLQFELLTTYFASRRQPERSEKANAHPLLGAPYGIYPTAAGFIAIAMTPIHRLARVIGCDGLTAFQSSDTFSQRDEIKDVLTRFLSTGPTKAWMEKLVPEDIWCMEVLNWHAMVEHEAYQALQMEQDILTREGKHITTTRCPIRWNGHILYSPTGAPGLGEHTSAIIDEFNLRRP